VIAASALLLNGVKASLTDDLNRLFDPGPAVAALAEVLPDDRPVVVVDFYRGSFSWHLRGPHTYVYGDAADTVIGETPRPLGLLVDGDTATADPAWLDGAEPLGAHRIEAREVMVYLLR
jgi:hypothetical protein